MAEIATQSIDVDLTPGGVTPFLYVSQGDYGSRKLIFNLTLNGIPYSIPGAVKTVMLEGATKTGNLFSVTCSINTDRKSVTASLIENMTSDVGMDLCQILFITDDNDKLGSANFFIIVEPSPFSTVVKYANVYWAELAKSWAIGGTGLRNGEDTNNAKYFASIIDAVRPQVDKNTNDVAVLAAQIDQHITPSSQNVDEVVDGRIAFDGTVYPTIGDAIRTQATLYGYIPSSEEIYFRHNS